MACQAIQKSIITTEWHHWGRFSTTKRWVHHYILDLVALESLWATHGCRLSAFGPLMGTLGPRWAAPGSLMAVLGTFVVDVKTSLVSLSDQVGSANFRFHLGSSLWQSL